MSDAPSKMLIQTELHSHSSNYEEFDHLRPFTCGFDVFRNDSDRDPVRLGVITGWFGIAVLDRPVASEGDGISADSELISRIAQEILDEQDWSEELIENVLLVDRISIEEEFRGVGFLPLMMDTLVSSFGLHKVGCLMVTQPEPQRPGGGPYPDGPERLIALSGLQRTLTSAGFEPWEDTVCYFRRIPVT